MGIIQMRPSALSDCDREGQFLCIILTDLTGRNCYYFRKVKMTTTILLFIECSLYAELNALDLFFMGSSQPSLHPGIIIVPALQMRGVGLREVKSLAEGHTAGLGQRGHLMRSFQLQAAGLAQSVRLLRRMAFLFRSVRIWALLGAWGTQLLSWAVPRIPVKC